MAYIHFRDVEVTGGFWKIQQENNQKITQTAVYERFKETGRFEAIACSWKKGEKNKPHIFWDSDIAKWIEGAAYILETHPNPEIEEIIDKVVDNMEKNQLESGYFNSYFLTIEPNEIFTRRMDHELYCAGHFLEGAIAYYEATGKEKMLCIMERYIDYIDERFRIKQDAAFDTPGHQEIEMAIYRLYVLRNREKDLLLLRYLINMRGKSEKDKNHDGEMSYTQSHLPVREQKEAVGHCVRALYLYCAMADLALIDNDKELLCACQELFQDMIQKKMYITGGVGSTYLGEAFTYPFDLPDYTAYTETCASIALAMFCRRMWTISPNGEYADFAERAVYNTVLVGISLSGDHFFYENPLAVNMKKNRYNDDRKEGEKERIPIAQRVKIFECSCCPPNLLRFIASIGDYAYSVQNDTIYTHMYMNSIAKIQVGKLEVVVEQQTQYPYDNQVRFIMKSSGNFKMAFRIPAWARQYDIWINGKQSVEGQIGTYVILQRYWVYGDEVQIIFEKKVQVIHANPLAVDLCGRCAVLHGPIVYCAEGVDHEQISVRDIRIGTKTHWKIEQIEINGRKMEALTSMGTSLESTDALYLEREAKFKPTPIKLIPYYAWGNRGAVDMSVWLLMS